MTAAERASFKKAIWQNYEEQGRRFPWRETADPYAIMVSEFMLQQTQTLRVVPKYESWLEQFPTGRHVAEAPLSQVLSAWNGLGYNRRAAFLQQSCQMVCGQYGGILPRDVEALDALPGIGAYTARAIATFAFNQPEVFIETNIRSVYIHFFFSRAEAVSDKELLPLIEETLDRENPRVWYYALMDYGAELKRLTVNPSRKSSGYTRQSAFKGSLRQARGAILRQLSAHESVTLEMVCASEGIDMERLEKAAQKLCGEQLIRLCGGSYVIS